MSIFLDICIQLHTYSYITMENVMPKSIPISLRISEEDAAYISSLEMSEAVTPSEKIRALIKESRKNRERNKTPEQVAARMQEQTKAFHETILSVEREHRRAGAPIQVAGRNACLLYRLLDERKYSHQCQCQCQCRQYRIPG